MNIGVKKILTVLRLERSEWRSAQVLGCRPAANAALGTPGHASGTRSPFWWVIQGWCKWGRPASEWPAMLAFSGAVTEGCEAGVNFCPVGAAWVPKQTHSNRRGSALQKILFSDTGRAPHSQTLSLCGLAFSPSYGQTQVWLASDLKKWIMKSSWEYPWRVQSCLHYQERSDSLLAVPLANELTWRAQTFQEVRAVENVAELWFLR